MRHRFAANLLRAGLALTFVVTLSALAGCGRQSSSMQSTRQPRESATPPLSVIYHNDFDGPIGQSFPEWTSSPIKFHKTITAEHGTLAAGIPAIVESPNHRQRFLGEFGGPPIGKPGERDWNRTRVEQSVLLSLKDLPRHTRIAISFDLYVLKSWDGNSPRFGPDRFSLRVVDGDVLLDTTFSNNPKVKEDGSTQSHPARYGERGENPPQTGAVSIGTLGYGDFFKDSVYHFSLEISHTQPALTLQFTSSLFEGKGIEDESWGIDNVTVRAGVSEAPAARLDESRGLRF